jgi:hypothetical protein
LIVKNNAKLDIVKLKTFILEELKKWRMKLILSTRSFLNPYNI